MSSALTRPRRVPPALDYLLNEASAAMHGRRAPRRRVAGQDRAGRRDDGRMTGQRDPGPRTSYQILVRGHLGATMRRAFPDLQAETRGPDTLLQGALEDQAALHGVLAQIAALGLELLEVRRLPDLRGPAY
jgi:hypothetical protein